MFSILRTRTRRAEERLFFEVLFSWKTWRSEVQGCTEKTLSFRHLPHFQKIISRQLAKLNLKKKTKTEHMKCWQNFEIFEKSYYSRHVWMEKVKSALSRSPKLTNLVKPTLNRQNQTSNDKTASVYSVLYSFIYFFTFSISNIFVIWQNGSKVGKCHALVPFAY